MYINAPNLTTKIERKRPKCNNVYRKWIMISKEKNIYFYHVRYILTLIFCVESHTTLCFTDRIIRESASCVHGRLGNTFYP